MVHKVLTGAGLEFGKTYTETRFLKPPKSSYATYSDTQTVRGPDNVNALVSHEINIELYEYAPDPELEAAIEQQFDTLGQEYIKQPRYWIAEEQVYQIIYEFSYLAKKGEINYGSI